jgi:hypothetical protein
MTGKKTITRVRSCRRVLKPQDLEHPVVKCRILDQGICHISRVLKNLSILLSLHFLVGFFTVLFLTLLISPCSSPITAVQIMPRCMANLSITMEM